jgi:ssDNA-binding replication factor A large subunit
MEKVYTTVRILAIPDEPEEITRPYGVQRVLRCVVGDETGLIALMFWNEDIEIYAEVGNIIKLNGAATKTYKGEIQLHPARSENSVEIVDDPMFSSVEELKEKFFP